MNKQLRKFKNKMNKELRKLYNKTLKNKWLPLLEDYKNGKSLLDLHGIIKQKCCFCHDSSNYWDLDCKNCKINRYICSDYGRKGFYSIIDHRIRLDGLEQFEMEWYLKTMIKLLKREKLKHIFKRNKKK